MFRDNNTSLVILTETLCPENTKRPNGEVTKEEWRSRLVTQAHQQDLEPACVGLESRGRGESPWGGELGLVEPPTVPMELAEHRNANLKNCSPRTQVRTAQAVQRLA